jgi:threonine/homoserine/homoserine lactone efflux protein
MWLALLQGISFATAPLLAFSPFKVFVFSQALQQGWRRSLPLALVPLLADIPVILLLWVALRQLPAWSVDLLRMTGGLFYVYLAYSVVRKARQPVRENVLANAPHRTFGQAITAVWVSPQIYINWSIIGIPALLGYAAQSPWHMVAFLLGFYLLWVGGLALQIMLVGQAGKISPHANTYIVGIAAFLLVGFGLYQFWLGITNLLGG